MFSSDLSVTVRDLMVITHSKFVRLSGNHMIITNNHFTLVLKMARAHIVRKWYFF